MKCSKCPSYSDEPHRFWCPDRFRHVPEESGARTSFDCGVRRVPESMKINVQPDLFRAEKLIPGSGYAPTAVIKWGDNEKESKALTIDLQHDNNEQKMTVEPKSVDASNQRREEVAANHRRLMEVLRNWNLDNIWNMR